MSLERFGNVLSWFGLLGGAFASLELQSVWNPKPRPLKFPCAEPKDKIAALEVPPGPVEWVAKAGIVALDTLAKQVAE